MEPQEEIRPAFEEQFACGCGFDGVHELFTEGGMGLGGQCCDTHFPRICEALQDFVRKVRISNKGE